MDVTKVENEPRGAGDRAGAVVAREGERVYRMRHDCIRRDCLWGEERTSKRGRREGSGDAEEQSTKKYMHGIS